MGHMPDTSAADLAQIRSTAPEAPRAQGVSASQSNDEFLANSINELKTKDADYLRLQSETARAEWENMTRENLRRQRAVESNQAEIEQLNLSQRDATEAKHNSELFQYAKELANRLRILTAHAQTPRAQKSSNEHPNYFTRLLLALTHQSYMPPYPSSPPNPSF